MTKQRLFPIIAMIYCSCLIISNIIAGKTFSFFSWSLPCAVIIFPLVYILNDTLTEIYGFTQTRKVILTGFAMNLIAVMAYTITIHLSCSDFFVNQSAFECVLGNTPRMLIASFVAYIIGSFVNAKIMDVMHNRLPKYLMARCIGSTLCGETIDAFLFISIAFTGTMPFKALCIMIIAQALFKTCYEIIVYPFTYLVINRLRKMKDE